MVFWGFGSFVVFREWTKEFFKSCCKSVTSWVTIKLSYTISRSEVWCILSFQIKLILTVFLLTYSKIKQASTKTRNLRRHRIGPKKSVSHLLVTFVKYDFRKKSRLKNDLISGGYLYLGEPPFLHIMWCEFVFLKELARTLHFVRLSWRDKGNYVDTINRF